MKVDFDDVWTVVQKVFDNYIKAYQAGNICFSEFCIVENILIKLQSGLRQLDFDEEPDEEELREALGLD